MPLYCVHGLDHVDRQSVREANYSAHRSYLETAAEAGITLHASGPLTTEDGGRMIGSLFILEAADHAAVVAFNADDPFARAGLWAHVSINRFNLRIGRVGTSPDA
ncbi:MAG: YciI family protein [Bosea sp. (in: a-proteobacteria)]